MDEVAVLTARQIEEYIDKSIRSTMEELVPKIVRRATQKLYLSKKDLMELTGWSSRQVEYRKANRSIPFVKRGRTILFPTEEIYQFLEDGKVEIER